jgi:hypothetical protein
MPIAFPSYHGVNSLGANGYGRNATGGRGGRLIFVTRNDDPTLSGSTLTNMDNLGAGSLRWALTRTYPRIIVVVVSGYINLTSVISLEGSQFGNFTFIGFLAEGGGFSTRYYQVLIRYCENIIIRGWKGRLGDVYYVSGDAGNNLAQSSVDPSPLENAIIDRSTFTWGWDQSMSFSRGENVTVQNCIIAEGLNDSIHSKGQHGFGSIIGGNNVSFHHNLVTCFTDRLPLCQTQGSYWATGRIDILNNAFFNWRTRATAIELHPTLRVNILYNDYKVGPALNPSVSQIGFVQLNGDTVDQWGQIYLEGNKQTNLPAMTDDVESQKQGIRFRNSTLTTDTNKDAVTSETQFSIAVGTYNFSETVAQAKTNIDLYVGHPNRDSIDNRIISQWKTAEKVGSVWSATPSMVAGSKTGYSGIIDSQTDVGGWVTLASGGSFWDALLLWLDTNGYEDRPAFSDPTNVTQLNDLAEYLEQIDVPSGYSIIELYSHWYLDPTDPDPEPTESLLTVSVNFESRGSVNTTGGLTAHGSTVTLIATKNTGFDFNGWYEVDGAVRTFKTNLETYVFAMPSRALNIEAVFVVEEVEPVPEGGFIFAILPEPIV